MEQTRGNPKFILFQKLKILKRNLKEWNRVSFGNLKLKIAAAEEKVLQAQLQFDSLTGCKIRASQPPSSGRNSLEAKGEDKMVGRG